jgi:peptidoglycan/LPS O-acetylase OafA/YrhL
MGLMSIPFIWTLESGWAITAVGLSGVYFGAAAILLASFTVPEPTSRAVGALAFLGSHSYSIYIWHMAVNTALLTLGLAWWTYAASYLICSLIIGVAFAILIEFPILRVRDRLWPDRVQPEEPWSGATLHSF